MSTSSERRANKRKLEGELKAEKRKDRSGTGVADRADRGDRKEDREGGTESKEKEAGTGKRGELCTPRLGPAQFPKEYPLNRDGYRYILAEEDPHAPLRKVSHIMQSSLK